MARIYTRKLELPGVTVPDWDLLARLEKLFDPYRPIVSARNGELFRAVDTRGEYTAVSSADLRQQVLEQDEPPREICIFAAGKTVYGQTYELIVELRNSSSTALLQSEAEEIVDHVAVRLRAILPASTAAEFAPAEPPATHRWWKSIWRLINHPWVVAIVGGLIVTAIVFYFGWFGGGGGGTREPTSTGTTTATMATTPASGSGGSPPPGGKTYVEVETPNHPVKTFQNHRYAFNQGPQVAAGQRVRVSCKVFDPTLDSVRPDGFWYLLHSPPWNDQFFAPANTFLNGDPAHGPYSHNTDFDVPDCLT